MSSRLKNSYHSILALEGFWPESPSRGLLGKTLTTLNKRYGIGYCHKSPLTLSQFKTELTSWTQYSSDYKILCLSFHGDNGLIYIGNTRFYLSEIADILEGSCQGRAIYFSSCNTLNISQEKIKKFMLKTKISRLVGYEDQVNIEKSIKLDETNLLNLCKKESF